MEHRSIPETQTSSSLCCKGRRQLGGGGKPTEALLQAVPLLPCGLCRRTAAIPGGLHRASASYPSLCRHVRKWRRKEKKDEEKRVTNSL